MKVYIGLQDEMDEFSPTPVEFLDDSLQRIFKSHLIYETTMENVFKLIPLLKENPRSQQVLEIYCPNEGMEVKNRRIFDYSREIPNGISPGDYYATGFFLPSDFQIVGQSYQIDEHTYHVLGWGKKDSGHCLFICCPYSHPQVMVPPQTQREALKLNFSAEANSPFKHLPEKMEVDGEEIILNTHSMSYWGTEEESTHDYFFRQYLLQLNLLPKEMAGQSMVLITNYTSEEVYQATPPASKITLSFQASRKEFLVEQGFTATFDGAPQVLTYVTDIKLPPRQLFIENLVLVDLYEHIKNPEEHRASIQHLEKHFPRDKRLVFLTYENPHPEVSPCFHLQEKLDTPLGKLRESSRGGVGIIGLRNNGTGSHGLPLQYHFLSDLLVSPDFHESIPMVLFSVSEPGITPPSITLNLL